MKTRIASVEQTDFTLERVPCNLCNADDPLPIYTKDAMDLVRCRNCELVYVSPRLKKDQVLALYDQAYFNAQDDFIRGTRIYKGGYRDYLGDRVYNQQTFRRRMNEIENYAGEVGRLLEVGCAAGFFLSVARERGWHVEGIEPAEFVASYARKHFSVPVFNGTLEEFQLTGDPYDMVAIWDALEHVPDPRQTLTRVHELLKPDGLLVISTQDINSWIARILGTNWYQIGLHFHLFYFSPKTIRSFLTATGFHVINITRKAAGKVCSFRFLVDKLSAYNPIVFRLACRALLAYPPLSRKAIYVNPGDEMITYARKKT